MYIIFLLQSIADICHIPLLQMSSRTALFTTTGRSWAIGLILLSILFNGCKKDETVDPEPGPATPDPSVTLRIVTHIDAAELLFDQMIYITPGNVPYSVSRAEYYISRIVLHGANATPNDTLAGPFHVSGTSPTEFSLGALAAGTYSGAELVLGLTPDLNVTGGLPNTQDNINMAWPDMMGGGYHFIKFEGHFLNADSIPTGFAIHIGNNSNLPQADMTQPFTMNGGSGILNLRFNLNELFRTPNDYDLTTGNSSMSSMILMTRLKENAVDAFTLEYMP